MAASNTRRVRKVVPPRRTRTKWQRRRDDALRDAGYTKADVWRLLKRTGTRVGLSSVRAVLDGRYRDEKIEEAFCILVDTRMGKPLDIGASRTKYFPAGEPPYRSAAQE